MSRSPFACIAIAVAVSLSSCFEPPPRPRIIPATKDADVETSGSLDSGPEADLGVADVGDGDSNAPDDGGVEPFDGALPPDADARDGDSAAAPDEIDASGPNCTSVADCPPAASCHGAADCDGASGTCVYPPLTGTPCEDGDICTDLGTCQTGVCVSPAKVCDDGIACTEDSCDSQKGCRHDLSGCNCTKDGDCDDGDPCTVGESCKSLSCVGGAAVDCSGLDAACTVGQCDSADGECGSAPRPDGAPCDDGDPCTSGDGCVAGSCEAGGAACDDGNACTVDSCDGSTGACSNVAVADGVVCDDGDACTIGDTCNAGQCAALKRLDATIAWEASLHPLVVNFDTRPSVSDTGITTFVVNTASWPTLTHTGGTELLKPFGAEELTHWATFIVRLDAAGALKSYTVIRAEQSVDFLQSVLTPSGEAFVVMEHSADVSFFDGWFRVTAAGATASAATLLYFDADGALKWSLRFQLPGLYPKTVFYIGGAAPRVGVIASHFSEATGPVVSGPTAPALAPAADDAWSLSALTWTLDGEASLAKNIAWYQSGGPPRVRAVGDADQSFAVTIQARTDTMLVGLGPTAPDPVGDNGVIVGRFTASGLPAAFVTARSPSVPVMADLAYASSQGVLATVGYKVSITAADGIGPETTVIGEASEYSLDGSCLFRIGATGGFAWPLNCAVPAHWRAAVLAADGRVTALGDGWEIASPKGGEFRVADAGSPVLSFVAEITATGQIDGLATLGGSSYCVNLARRPAAGGWSVGCWGVENGDAMTATYEVRDAKLAAPAACAPLEPDK